MSGWQCSLAFVYNTHLTGTPLLMPDHPVLPCSIVLLLCTLGLPPHRQSFPVPQPIPGSRPSAWPQRQPEGRQEALPQPLAQPQPQPSAQSTQPLAFCIPQGPLQVQVTLQVTPQGQICL